MTGDFPPDAPIERIRRHLVGLRMPRALGTLDHLVQQIERGHIGTIEAIEGNRCGHSTLATRPA